MSFSDWLDYLTVSAALQPYWKATVKYLLTHVPALCLGVFAFVCSKPYSKEAAMNPMTTKLKWTDILTAYPLFIPFWIGAFLYLLMEMERSGGMLGFGLALFLLLFWLRGLLDASTRLFEHYARQEQETLSLNPETAVLTSAN